MTGDRTLDSACTLTTHQPQEKVSALLGWGQALKFEYRAASSSWIVTGDGVNETVTQRDRWDAPWEGEVYAGYRVLGSRIELQFQPLIAAEPRLEYTYYSFLVVPSSSFPESRLYVCMLGVPTLASDLPLSFSGAYPRGELRIDGTYQQWDGTQGDLGELTSSPTVAVDFVRSTIRASTTVTVEPGGGQPPVDIAIVGEGRIDPQTGNFSGTLASANGSIAGTFAGRFMGPQARELAYVMRFEGRDADGVNTSSFRGSGWAAR